MNKSAFIKIAGILLGTFIVITIAIFFLYPYLNTQKYEQIQAERDQRSLPGEFQSSDSDSVAIAGFNSLEADSAFEQNKEYLRMKVDSLIAANDSLTQKLNSATNSLKNFESALGQTGVEDSRLADIAEGNMAEFVAASVEPEEEFAERVKSLLNLDEEDLTPIANQMTQQELVKIYSNSGNIQREKLLRSLSPERATKLMQEIML